MMQGFSVKINCLRLEPEVAEIKSDGLSRISVTNKLPRGFSAICAKARRMIDKFTCSAQATLRISNNLRLKPEAIDKITRGFNDRIFIGKPWFMMIALPKKQYISPEEYLAAERESLERHEYFDGEIFQMAGSINKHNLITSNTIISLGNQLKKRDCRVYPPDMRVHIPKTGLFTYPDVLVVCGKPQLLPDANLDTLTNPVLIIEVLSASTENYDKSIKFDNYRSLESLREYVLISQDAKKVMRYTKQADGSWILMDFIGDKTEIELSSIDCVLAMEDIYDNIDFDEE